MLTKRQDAVALTLFSWFTIKKRRYGLIGREWLLKQIEISQGIKMSMRTLDRSLAKLRENGLLYSETRHRRDTKTGAFCPEISIYYFTDELKKYVNKFFRFFKRLFGYGDFTEYTVCATTDNYRQQNTAKNLPVKPDPPERPSHYTKWENLGRARA